MKTLLACPVNSGSPCGYNIVMGVDERYNVLVTEEFGAPNSPKKGCVQHL